MNPPLFSISILAYNNLALTRKCLESVASQGGDFELILTDNGSKDGVGAYMDEFARAESAKRPVSVVHNKKNLGFIEPNRQAFKRAIGKYFVMLNNDTTVSPHWLDLLKAPFQGDPLCALTGPAGGCCQLRSDFVGELGPRFEYLEGAMLCADREKIMAAQPDLFPPELAGAYGEDSFLSLRMREAGYTLHRVAIDFKHARAATTAMVPQAREWQAKNHEFLKQRFRNYMVSRRFNFPTIIKRNAARGDVLLTTAVIRGLKSIRPLSPIFVETHCPEALERNPDIFHVGASVPYSPDALQINLNGISEMNPAVPIVDAYAACAGIELEDETTSIYPPQPDIEWAKRTVDSSWVAVFAGPTTWRCKNWPFDRWSEVIRWLQESGVRVVLVGGDPVPPTLKADLDLRSRTTVGQLGALLGEVGLFVGLDSFPIHVAQAMKTPVVGLFGITSADKILTRGSHWIAVSSDPDHPGTGLRHKIAGKTHVDHPDNPMDTISVDQVKAAISEMLPALSGRKTQ